MLQLRVGGLGKASKRYTCKSGRLREWLGRGVQHELNGVLRDVSFEVGAAEAVGTVDANGAGKSTLLKIIAGTVKPTMGGFELSGRVSALLESHTAANCDWWDWALVFQVKTGDKPVSVGVCVLEASAQWLQAPVPLPHASPRV